MHREEKVTRPWFVSHVMRGPEGFRITGTFDEALPGVLVSTKQDSRRLWSSTIQAIILVAEYRIHDPLQQRSTCFGKSCSILSPVSSSGVHAARRREMRAEM